MTPCKGISEFLKPTEKGRSYLYNILGAYPNPLVPNSSTYPFEETPSSSRTHLLLTPTPSLCLSLDQPVS